MFGYFTKHDGYVYDGAHLAAETLHNGDFVEITAEGVKKIAAKGDAVLCVAPDGKLTAYWGKPALVLDVVSAGTKEYFMVENEWDVTDGTEYDTSNYEVKKGELVRMRRPVIGDQVIVEVTTDILNAAEVGKTYNPNAGGSVVATA